MKILITLRKISDNSFHKEFEFTEYPVKLGRESDNNVILEDPLKIISRSHAKIVNSDGLIQILDLGSSNFTYLNGDRLFSNNEAALKTGDIIKIGDYELDVVLEQLKSVPVFDDQKTMMFASPFDEDVSKISDAISKLSEKYFYDESSLKSEMLRVSVMKGFDTMVSTDVNQILSEYFASKFLDQYLPNLNKKDVPSVKITQEEKPKAKAESHSIHSDTSSKSSADYSFSTHFSESVDIMLETVIKLIQGFLHFRQEFFGVTIYHTIPTGSLKEIKDFLFNQEIPAEEQRKRINLIKEETQKLLSHQIGLLEGYRTSVTEGSQSLLQSLDPEIIEKETASKPSSGLEGI
ncbi:MAG: FHA domain-containing protein, partial [Ignavibacteria bacterium]|nr:FHA domain-containing protein [Ignavibacteria bacterium]